MNPWHIPLICVPYPMDFVQMKCKMISTLKKARVSALKYFTRKFMDIYSNRFQQLHLTPNAKPSNSGILSGTSGNALSKRTQGCFNT
jgi:hypothetical protein